MARRKTRFKTKRALSLIESVYRAQQQRCFYCKEPISLEQGPGYRTLDHFIPLKKGGIDSLANIVLSCHPCNASKADHMPTPEEQRAWNLLANVLPHLKPIFPDGLETQNACIRCGDAISQERLVLAARSSGQTQVCSRRCARAQARKRLSERKKNLHLLAQTEESTAGRALEGTPTSPDSGWGTDILPTAAPSHQGPQSFRLSDHGYILSLRDLRRLLTFISQGEHQWTIALDQADDIDSCTRLDIAYTNPGPEHVGLPNDIIIRFPILRASMGYFQDREEDTYVCLYGDISTTVQNGLYVDDGLVKGDVVHDSEIFWTPLLDALRRAADSLAREQEKALR